MTPDLLAKSSMASADHTRSPQLPEKPVITIESSKAWVALSLRDLWAYRELLYFLTWRDVKVRYKQTLLGQLGQSFSHS